MAIQKNKVVNETEAVTQLGNSPYVLYKGSVYTREHRKAEIGELVEVVNPGKTSAQAIKGEVLKVAYSGKYHTNRICTEREDTWMEPDQYNVLVPVSTYKRPAVVGDKILIVSRHSSIDPYNNGDVLTVSVVLDSGDVLVECGARDMAYVLYREYVVLLTGSQDATTTVLPDAYGLKREYRLEKRRAGVGEMVFVHDVDSAYEACEVVTIRYRSLSLVSDGRPGGMLSAGQYSVLVPTGVIVANNGKRYSVTTEEPSEGDTVVVTEAEDGYKFFLAGDVGTLLGDDYVDFNGHGNPSVYGDGHWWISPENGNSEFAVVTEVKDSVKEQAQAQEPSQTSDVFYPTITSTITVNGTTYKKSDRVAAVGDLVLAVGGSICGRVFTVTAVDDGEVCGEYNPDWGLWKSNYRVLVPATVTSSGKPLITQTESPLSVSPLSVSLTPVSITQSSPQTYKVDTHGREYTMVLRPAKIGDTVLVVGNYPDNGHDLKPGTVTTVTSFPPFTQHGQVDVTEGYTLRATHYVVLETGEVPDDAPKSKTSKLKYSREEIVAKAKDDVKALLKKPIDSVHPEIGRPGWYSPEEDTVSFSFDQGGVSRASITAKPPYSSGVWAKGIAVCSPDDCFNAHIGKAIALRRALGLPVPSEYLSVPQPTGVQPGDMVTYYSTVRQKDMGPYVVTSVTNSQYSAQPRVGIHTGGWMPQNEVKVVDDTDRYN